MGREFAISIIFFAFIQTGKTTKFYEEKHLHTRQILPDETIKELANLTDMKHFKTVLNEILIPRVVGTPNHVKVGNYIVDQMRDLGWFVTADVFDDDTPIFGKLRFRNIIARLNPIADRYLVLACHYDSKYMPDFKFVGATDSAVPCTMMINLAKVMQSQLEPLKNAHLSLMFIYFDGEEAFENWTATDSLYGSRHLATLWKNTIYKQGVNHLARMDLMVLLDLLGAPNPVFKNYFAETRSWYVLLSEAEQRLSWLNLMETSPNEPAERIYFRPQSGKKTIADDHVPFVKNHVNVIHVIATPFPAVWHKETDNESALDYATIENLNKIFRIFVSEYLNL